MGDSDDAEYSDQNSSVRDFVPKNTPCSKSSSRFGSKGIKGSNIGAFVKHASKTKSSGKLVNALWLNQNDLAKSHAEIMSAIVNPTNTKNEGVLFGLDKKKFYDKFYKIFTSIITKMIKKNIRKI
jgi:hypothetical protein